MFLIRIERLTGGHTAQAAFFSSRHAENVILVCRAPPAAHGRRDQVGPFQHFFVGSAFESSHCSRVLHQRVDSRVDEQFIGLVNEEVTHSGLCQSVDFLPCSKRSPSCSCSNAMRQRAPTRQPSRPAANLLTSASSNSPSSWNVPG